ncbi:uncharacterized protein K452DRAFT_38426 [Aplosporella prunicola CBS 121167]|uniref:Uncharacterized protein n=1 Tax=Aplosporella prunicola CBS 121167 TaxID=1176127 RepID=A0A6A6BFT9_9PEZI|nr:uncharacterized protein K452DRAFT_38426 [Aplosporella prunicola CBS 121167]KAF2141361.1 hypothetical protein K452DRAFT_38426 [Aplosporella prunicola CBS 121167]
MLQLRHLASSLGRLRVRQSSASSVLCVCRYSSSTTPGTSRVFFFSLPCHVASRLLSTSCQTIDFLSSFLSASIDLYRLAQS